VHIGNPLVAIVTAVKDKTLVHNGSRVIVTRRWRTSVRQHLCPDARRNVKDVQVIQCFLAIPATKDIKPSINDVT